MALVGERIADAIAAAGTELVFGLLSSSNLRTMSRLVDRHGVAFHNSRHEAAAVGMADGYARATGRIGVCSVTQGPGFTNSLTALLTAERGSSPVLLFAGDSSTIDASDNPFSALVQGLDQERVLAALGIPAVWLTAANVERVTAEAFGLARQRRGPVVVLVPAQLQHQEHPVDVAPPVADSSTVQLPDGAAVAAAAGIVAGSHRPVVLAGLGAVEADAGATLVALADRAGALLATTVRAAGLFAGHAYDLGIAGGFAAPAAADLLRQADCVLAFGASLNPFTMRSGLGEARARIIHCDLNPGRFLLPEVTITGDAREVAELLLRALPEPATGSWRAQAASVLGGPAQPDQVTTGSPAPAGHGTVDPRELCNRLDALLPPDRVVVTDSGYSTLFPVEHVRVLSPRNLLFMLDFGAVGSGIGPAMGAALGRPGAPVVLFVGDGGLLMTLGELDTAQRYGIPMLIVCLNDRAYGAEVSQAVRHGLPTTLATFPDTRDVADIARAIGVPGRTVRDLADLADIPQLVRDLTGPYLLDCRIPTVTPRTLSNQTGR